jgi:hypothetical protein
MSSYIIIATSDETQERSYFNGKICVSDISSAHVFRDKMTARSEMGLLQSSLVRHEVVIHEVVHSFALAESGSTARPELL